MAKLEKLIVVDVPEEGVINRTYAYGERRSPQFYADRLERGWLPLKDRLRIKAGDDKESRDD